MALILSTFDILLKDCCVEEMVQAILKEGGVYYFPSPLSFPKTEINFDSNHGGSLNYLEHKHHGVPALGCSCRGVRRSAPWP